MESLYAILVGILFSCSFFLLMRRNIVRIILGIALLSQACNLLIFICGRIVRAQTPIISEKHSTLLGNYADPLPQALILTAIVISFGILAFCLILYYKLHQQEHIEDIDQLSEGYHES